MKITVNEAKKNEAADFHHITEEERKAAQDLWNKFNADLLEKGMKLYYDYDGGGFYVAAFELKPGHSKDAGALNEDELKKVVYEGGFDDKAVNNPPWFTDSSGYTLVVKG